MSVFDSAVKIQRKLVRRLNWRGVFFDSGNDSEPVAIVAGYTRSGTTFLGRVLANLLHARPVHEPLNPASSPEVSFFNERESRSKLISDRRYNATLRSVFSKSFKGTRLTNTGSRLFYDGRVVKVVRANHYADHLSELFNACPFVVIMRNPYACVSSRLKLNWPVPDHSHCFEDIEPYLSQQQKDMYHRESSVAAKLAISWCLDNLMLLRNRERENFLFVHYESILVRPEEELTRVLKHIGAGQHAARIERELRLEWGDSDGKAYLNSWQNHLGSEQIADIQRVLNAFGLSHLYSDESGMPSEERLFEARG